ncbi:low molecular weight protein-tyrosine-phosphatase [Paenibacillus hexagrammi]|uniref:protein-tyrosine-phosphatase n=1 Tax=Paenibacillus hexagrammi TaxID=2908839 RepID=A0ABY3SNM9_9BACL|nr:low molecular weight protein-tyrosine-phosphatase [Paenibacillus sp. YPD9-1]UJF35417.1 low molecular weight phosphotyrosine protein phosphatase [Paenibacillus sp. YPD9-1]
MSKVLFVCLGNICRSPMAEAVFRSKVKEAGLERQIDIDSAGTGDWHLGEPPHEGTRSILKSHGISYDGMKSRLVKTEDFNDYTYIIAMDASNIRNLQTFAPDSYSASIHKLLEFAPDASNGDVPDPYYTGNFNEVFEMVDESCERLLAYIRNREGI